MNTFKTIIITIVLIVTTLCSDALVLCPNSQYVCRDGSTCCRTSVGQMVCCGLPDANCCGTSAGYCCPNGYTCDLYDESCQRALATAFAVRVEKVHPVFSFLPVKVTAEIAALIERHIPVPEVEAQFVGHNTTFYAKELLDGEESIGMFACTDGSLCPSSMTCCSRPGQKSACCKHKNAVCCAGGSHCCPSGSQCDSVTGSCISAVAKLPWDALVAY
eukprot:Colp12_sorted_trinity150504_noHs@13326